MDVIRIALLTSCLSSVACAHAIVRPATSPAKPATDAVLVLPGFGYSRDAEQVFRSLAPSVAAGGFDFYVAKYISRGGLDDSRDNLRRFVREQRLDRYERVHVFAFIAGGWTFNPLAETVPNLATVVYDRSPYQERAPAVARQKVPVLTWLKFGTVVFDVAKTPYAPLDAPGVRVGIVVEMAPTPFIRRFAKAADRQGPYRFGCGTFEQPYDDCVYLALNHSQLYARFPEVWPEIRSFIRDGRFTASANRTPPDVRTSADFRK